MYRNKFEGITRSPPLCRQIASRYFDVFEDADNAWVGATPERFDNRRLQCLTKRTSCLANPDVKFFPIRKGDEAAFR